MYKVIIVDDELLVISSLKNRVKWNEQGFEVVGEARNGIAAYEKIIELKPDVVFTDIRMAGMNGLELIQKANELSLNIQFVVISGYAEFAYAQKAINYGALGFCLKPFDENEIEAILLKIKIKLDKEKASHEALLLSLVEDSSQDGRVLREETLRKLGFASEAGKEFAMAVSIGPTALDLRGEYRNICLKIGKNKYVYIIEFSSKTSAKALTESQIFDCEKVPLDVKGIGISLVYNSYDFINKALEEAYMAAYQFFMNEDKRICRYTNRQQEEIDTVVKELRNALVSKNMASVEDNMDLLDQLFRKGDYYIKHASKVYNIFMYLFDREYF